jgi:hypothetical protein
MHALKMAKENHQPITTIAEVQAEMGDIAAALATAETVAADQKPEALRQVAVALAEAGRLEAAVSVVEKISAPAARDRAWIDIVVGVHRPLLPPDRGGSPAVFSYFLSA